MCRCRGKGLFEGAVVTWQREVIGQFPLEAHRLGPAVDSAPEGGRLTLLHRHTVGLDGDDRALETCLQAQHTGLDH